MKNSKRSEYKEKSYAHFTRRISPEKAKQYFINPEKVSRHGFFPFIHFQKNSIRCTSTSFAKFTSGEQSSPREKKLRDLCYCTHIDGYIYQHYSNKLNALYNHRTLQDGINNCSIAYRNNKHGKCNIHFAKEIIDFIRKTNECYIFVGDFTGFFDNLEHKYLKERLCDLLSCNLLEPDYYNVFKNITKYSIYELDDLLKLNNLDDYKNLNKKNVVLPIEDFRNSKSKYLKRNRKKFGIPQGSPISAVLSNIYMLDFDKLINDFITSNNGIYRRYSDDFIIVLPNINIAQKWDKIKKIINSIPKLALQPKKTKVFYFKHDMLRNCNTDFLLGVPNDKNILEYLGFSFDGQFVFLRDKTITKFYYRMYHKLDSISLRLEGKVDKRPDFLNLYRVYTSKGKMNFLTYVDRCIEVFGMNERVHLAKERSGRKLQGKINCFNKLLSQKKEQQLVMTSIINYCSLL